MKTTPLLFICIVPHPMVFLFGCGHVDERCLHEGMPCVRGQAINAAPRDDTLTVRLLVNASATVVAAVAESTEVGERAHKVGTLPNGLDVVNDLRSFPASARRMLHEEELPERRPVLPIQFPRFAA